MPKTAVHLSRAGEPSGVRINRAGRFRSLQVLNEIHLRPGEWVESRIQPHAGIGAYGIDGEGDYSDSFGNRGLLKRGSYQYLYAQTGAACTWRNPSLSKPLRFLEILFEPEVIPALPEEEIFAQKNFIDPERTGNLKLIASRTGAAGSLKIRHKARVFSGIIPLGEVILDRLPEGRHGWLQVVKGVLELNGEVLMAGDGAEIQGEVPFELKVPVRGAEAELLFLDLP